MKRRAPRRRGNAYGLFWSQVTGEGRARCVLRGLGGCAGPIDAHHVLPQRRIKQAFPFGGALAAGYVLPVRALEAVDPSVAVSLDALLADARNGVPVCRRHHDRIESRRERLPRSLAPEDFDVFLATIGMGWWAEREWPA